jgi:hypothetical protein
MEILTDRNFLIYAAQNYSNPCCHSTAEFIEDLRRIKYVKKLITRYVETGELKERLILNHLIVLSNTFRPEPLCRMLCLKAEQHLPYVKPFLVFLDICIVNILNVKTQRNIATDDIAMDQNIIDKLRKI